MNRQLMRLIAATLLLGLAAAGCAGTPIAVPTMGAALAALPTGTFVGTGVNATWSWVLRSDGTYYSSGTHSAERGTYSVTGNRMTLKGDLCGEVEGVYTWVSDGKLLTFTTINDSCADRRGIIAGSPWLKSP